MWVSRPWRFSHQARETAPLSVFQRSVCVIQKLSRHTRNKHIWMLSSNTYPSDSRSFQWGWYTVVRSNIDGCAWWSWLELRRGSQQWGLGFTAHQNASSHNTPHYNAVQWQPASSQSSPQRRGWKTRPQKTKVMFWSKKKNMTAKYFSSHDNNTCNNTRDSNVNSNVLIIQ